jgi:hypothetical protein
MAHRISKTVEIRRLRSEIRTVRARLDVLRDRLTHEIQVGDLWRKEGNGLMPNQYFS